MKHLLTIAALMLSMSSAAQNYEIVPDIEGQTSEYRDGRSYRRDNLEHDGNNDK